MGSFICTLIIRLKLFSALIIRGAEDRRGRNLAGLGQV